MIRLIKNELIIALHKRIVLPIIIVIFSILFAVYFNNVYLDENNDNVLADYYKKEIDNTSVIIATNNMIARGMQEGLPILESEKKPYPPDSEFALEIDEEIEYITAELEKLTTIVDDAVIYSKLLSPIFLHYDGLSELNWKSKIELENSLFTHLLNTPDLNRFYSEEEMERFIMTNEYSLEENIVPYNSIYEPNLANIINIVFNDLSMLCLLVIASVLIKFIVIDDFGKGGTCKLIYTQGTSPFKIIISKIITSIILLLVPIICGVLVLSILSLIKYETGSLLYPHLINSDLLSSFTNGTTLTIISASYLIIIKIIGIILLIISTMVIFTFIAMLISNSQTYFATLLLIWPSFLLFEMMGSLGQISILPISNYNIDGMLLEISRVSLLSFIVVSIISTLLLIFLIKRRTQKMDLSGHGY